MPQKNMDAVRICIKGINGLLCVAVFALFFATLAAQSDFWPFGSRRGNVYAEPAVMSAAAGSQRDGFFGNITIEVAGGISLPEAKVLINGRVAGDFAAGAVMVRVYEGDFVLLDTLAYVEDIRFCVTRMSSNICPEGLQLELFVTDGQEIIGKIAFK
ncbi:MAG: hypothetical protein FWD39_04195 [Clostridiales bacterium]|nr:hypothetical protein [Clostridiales bacterium]